MKAMIIKELRLISKDRRSFIFLLLMPILFIVMFGSVFNQGDGNSSITLRTVDQDQTAASRALIGQMEGIMDVKQLSADTLNDQLDNIKQGQFSSMLVIPSGFEQAMKEGKAANIKLYQGPASRAETAPIQAILGSISTEYREQKLTGLLMAKGDSKAQAEAALASPIQIENVAASSDHFDMIDQVVPGMTVMFVFFIMITMARRFFEEKKTGLLSRIRTTRIKPLYYLIGMWFPFVLTVIAQCVILFAFGHFVYGLKFGDIAALSAVIVCLSIADTGIGLGLSFVVPGEGAAMVITQLISMGGAMLGGLWVPSYLLPQTVQTIGHFMPQFWAQHSLQDIIAHGAHLSDIWGAALILLTFGLAGLTIALLRLPGFLRSAAN
ncbi:ABC transporter permease [Paenibacillus sp.]|jgi:ABC-2 type transport system permease protein|uniref:ABC transporter permease n=1 Tax=Paenibacillus sp. TaxID=58172 RepID=UPI0028225F28|nr:ABC transporter permease [Paenibacillus sp.]MDR0269205.1 ABC transporter permease [Paenibacillus sp.]